MEGSDTRGNENKVERTLLVDLRALRSCTLSSMVLIAASLARCLGPGVCVAFGAREEVEANLVELRPKIVVIPFIFATASPTNDDTTERGTGREEGKREILG